MKLPVSNSRIFLSLNFKVTEMLARIKFSNFKVSI